MKQIAQVHRYYDRVAVNVGGQTHYFTVKQAKELAKAIRLAAKDINTHPNFAKSGFATFYLEE